MKNFFCLLIAILLSTFATAWAVVQEGGSASIASGAKTITLKSPHRRVVVWTSASAANININFNTGVTAVTADPIIYGGATFAYGIGQPSPLTTTINYYGASASGTINWIAW